MNIKINESLVSTKFKYLILNEYRYNINFGSRGSGKSEHDILDLLLKSFSNEFVKILYVNTIFKNIRNQEYARLKRIAKSKNLDKFFRFYDGDYRIQNLISGHWFIPFGLDNIEATKGLDDITIIYWDECTRGTLEDFLTLDKLLRTPQGQYLQFKVSFNPINEKNWTRKYFFKENNAYELKDNFAENTLLIHSTFQDNEFIDREAYGQTLINGAVGDPSKLECDYYGRWGNEVKDNLFIHSFNKTRHNKPIELNDREIIYLSFDFNYNPMTCLVIQRDRFLDWIHIVKEYRLEKADVYAICREIKRDFKDLRYCEVYGDSSGWAHKAEAVNARPAFNTIIEELELVPSQVRQPRGKPKNYIQEKRTLANEIMALHPKFIIGNCPFLIDDIESIQVGEDYKMIKDKDASKSHLLDALCDFLYAQVRKDWDNWKHKNLIYDTPRG